MATPGALRAFAATGENPVDFITRHMKLDPGDRIIGVDVCNEQQDVLLTSQDGQAIRFPVDDVRTDLLEPSDLVTRCAYKGEASYFSVAGEPDVAWRYVHPLRDSAEIAGRVAFFNERVDIYVDGELQERAITPWSRRRREG